MRTFVAQPSEAMVTSRAKKHSSVREQDHNPNSVIPLQGTMTKLPINESGGPDEQEADRMVKRVTGQTEPLPESACSCGGGCQMQSGAAKPRTGELAEDANGKQLQRKHSRIPVR